MSSILKKHNFIFVVLLGFSLFERLYNKTSISGQYSIYIAILLIFFSFLFDTYIGKGKYKFDKRILLAIPLVLYFPCKESIRYMVFFVMIVMWGKYKINDLFYFVIFMISLGVILSSQQIYQGMTRISGFIYSPTLYACILVVLITYLLFEKKHQGVINKLFILISSIMIYMTGSSSAFVCMLGIIAYKICINMILSKFDKKHYISKSKRHVLTFVIVICLIFVGAYVTSNLEEVLSIISRDNRDASTLTRTKYLSYFINDYFSNILNAMFGHGGGYTQNYISSIIGEGKFYPLHQDIVMLLCEYGIVGFTYIYKIFISKLKFNWLVLTILVLCSFHNIILSPNVMVLILMVSNTLNFQNEYEKIWN